MEFSSRITDLGVANSLVFGVSGSAQAVPSRDWLRQSHHGWRSCMSADALPGFHALHYFVVSETRVRENSAVGVVAILAYENLTVLAKKCTIRAGDLLQMPEEHKIVLNEHAVVFVRMRMSDSWRDWLLKNPPNPAQLENKPIDADPLQLPYQIGLNKNQPYARWAALAYEPQLDTTGWAGTLARFVRQARLAALITGIPLSTVPDGPSAALSELACAMLIMPLRAHGKYYNDEPGKQTVGRPLSHNGEKTPFDFPSIPFFESNTDRKGKSFLAAYDCEDATGFAVRECETVAGLMRVVDTQLEFTGKNFHELLMDLRCATAAEAAAAATIGQIIRMAAEYAPLHLVIAFKRDGSSKMSDQLHVVPILVSAASLRALFGEDGWQLALSSARVRLAEDTHSHRPPTLTATARIDSGLKIENEANIAAVITENAPPCFVDACVFMDACVQSGHAWKHGAWDRATHRWGDNSKRWRYTLSPDDSVFGNAYVSAIYGAAAGLNFEVDPLSLSNLFSLYLHPDVTVKKPLRGALFTYDRVGALSLLPGPNFPAVLAQTPVPDPPAGVAVLGEMDDVGIELVLFDKMPYRKLVVL